MRRIEEIYVNNSYNSLSIEGFRVTPELIQRVRRGDWDPLQNRRDRETQDALAARGYYEAFQVVEQCIRDVLNGQPAGAVFGRDHPFWFQAMFSPLVRAGLLKQASLAGYRQAPVYIQGARHVPMAKEWVPDGMEALVGLLREEAHPAVRAVLGHFFFVYVHPYPDGNGRIGRFLMNVMLSSGGYPWTVIRLARRKEYMAALESASGDNDIAPLARFIAEEMAAI